MLRYSFVWHIANARSLCLCVSQFQMTRWKDVTLHIMRGNVAPLQQKPTNFRHCALFDFGGWWWWVSWEHFTDISKSVYGLPKPSLHYYAGSVHTQKWHHKEKPRNFHLCRSKWNRYSHIHSAPPLLKAQLHALKELLCWVMPLFDYSVCRRLGVLKRCKLKLMIVKSSSFTVSRPVHFLNLKMSTVTKSGMCQKRC